MLHSRAFILVAVTSILLVGCATDPEPSINGSATFDSAEAHNEADTAFLQEMIPHHEQAIVMADMAESAAQTRQLAELAIRINEAQQPEIDQMRLWLSEWGEEAPEPGVGGMDHSMMDDMDMDDMAGMMGEADLDRLGGMSGKGFDRMWLVMMIEHHEGAIETSRELQRDGENREVIALANKIEVDQLAEIAYMEGLIEDL